MNIPWKPALIVLAAVVVVGGAILAVTALGSSPAPRAVKSPTPHPSATKPAPLSPPPGTVAPSVAPTGQATSPAAVPSHPASPVHSAAPAASPTQALPPGLVENPNGFAYPAGWIPGPLITLPSRQVQTETVTNPSGVGQVDYMKESSPGIYNPDHTVDDTYIETAIEFEFPTCAYMIQLIPEANVGFRYVCTAPQGIQITGLALVSPYPRGAKVVQVEIPLSQGDTAVAILNAFH